MSKSLGNLVFVDQLRAKWDARAIRLAILEHHYREEWEWDDTLMPRAATRLDQWLGAASDSGDSADRKVLSEVRAALDDDLDVPRAVAAIDDAVARGDDVARAAALLGVDLSDGQ
jgi:L-cysteine:1D-myo-inositol 2-amino-2-deoxy-alpha-D-glucopyranoside ligase